jgi:hypothetical protein
MEKTITANDAKKSGFFLSSHKNFALMVPSRFKHFDPGLSRSLRGFPGFEDNPHVCRLRSVFSGQITNGSR